MVKRITNEDVINGKIDHIDIGEEIDIVCYNCADLIELPNWPKVTNVCCSNCNSLTSLPNWPCIDNVDCSNCNSLTSLPEWYSVNRVNCSDCNSLTSLPNWPCIDNVYCFNCNGLTELPEWYSVNRVNCSDCTGLTTLPHWQHVEVVECNYCTGLTTLPNWIDIRCIYCEGTMFKEFFNTWCEEMYHIELNFYVHDRYWKFDNVYIYKEFYDNYVDFYTCYKVGVLILKSNFLVHDLKRLLLNVIGRRWSSWAYSRVTHDWK